MPALTLRQFAEIVGLSPTTVSRALAGYPEVRDATRRRVRALAAEHGYRPNRRAAALATGRAMAIGHVIPAALEHEVVNPVFADFTAAAGEAYARAGYDMLMATAPAGGEEATYRRLAESGAVDGFIVHGPRAGDGRLGLLRRLGMPFVVHGRVPGERGYDFVDVANARAFEALTAHLIGLGHNRVALVNGRADMDFARRRQAGWAAAHRACGRTVDAGLVVHGAMTEAHGHDAASALLDGARPPSAFVAASLVVGLGVRRAAEARDLSVPGDLSIATHDDVLSYLGNDGAFTATRSSVREAGRRCGEMLLARIAEPGRPPAGEVWDAPLVTGRSTARRRTA